MRLSQHRTAAQIICQYVFINTHTQPTAHLPELLVDVVEDVCLRVDVGERLRVSACGCVVLFGGLEGFVCEEAGIHSSESTGRGGE